MPAVAPSLVEVKNRAEWRRWLSRNGTTSSGIWLTIHKKGSTSGSLSYDAAVEEALCFGWIDSKPGTLDDERYKLWMAPRKPKSAWPALNKTCAVRLMADGRITEAGFAAIQLAKGNGAWDALNASDALIVPDDLSAALRGVRGARAYWDAFPPGVRKQILEWINTARRPETRAKRVEETARLAGENVRANQWRPRS